MTFKGIVLLFISSFFFLIKIQLHNVVHKSEMDTLMNGYT